MGPYGSTRVLIPGKDAELVSEVLRMQLEGDSNAADRQTTTPLFDRKEYSMVIETFQEADGTC